MRRFMTLFMTLLFVMVPVFAQANTGQIQLVVNGTPVVTDVPPVIENDRTLVPIRALSETLGFEVGWDEVNRAVTLTKGEQVIVLYIGRGDTLVNGQPKPIDVPPVIRDDRTLIPVRFVAENLGLEVSWDPENRIVGVAQPAAVPTPAATIDPAAQAVWDNIGAMRNGRMTGTLNTEMMGMHNQTKIDGYVKGDDVLVYTTITLPGVGESTVGTAVYKGTVWQQMPGMGWTQTAASLGEVGVDVTRFTNQQMSLAAAKVQLSQDQLNGVSMNKLTIEWDNDDLAVASGGAPGDFGVGTTTLTFWVAPDGQLRQMDQLMTMKQDDVEMVTSGTYTWSPLEGEIPFPAEIVQ